MDARDGRPEVSLFSLIDYTLREAWHIDAIRSMANCEVSIPRPGDVDWEIMVRTFWTLARAHDGPGVLASPKGGLGSLGGFVHENAILAATLVGWQVGVGLSLPKPPFLGAVVALGLGSVGMWSELGRLRDRLRGAEAGTSIAPPWPVRRTIMLDEVRIAAPVAQLFLDARARETSSGAVAGGQ